MGSGLSNAYMDPKAGGEQPVRRPRNRSGQSIVDFHPGGSGQRRVSGIPALRLRRPRRSQGRAAPGPEGGGKLRNTTNAAGPWFSGEAQMGRADGERGEAPPLQDGSSDGEEGDTPPVERGERWAQELNRRRARRLVERGWWVP